MKHHKRPTLVALTGGIASGKTVVSKWFAEKGYTTHSADKIGHQILNRKDIQNKVTKTFGQDFLINGKIDRKKLGEIIFRSPSKRKLLNEILHPEISKRMQEIIDESTKKVLIFEIPLLFENNLHKAFDLTINISTSDDLKIERLKKRDNLTKEEILNRIESQMHDNKRVQLADINIINNNGLDTLFIQLEHVGVKINKIDKKNTISLIDIKEEI